MNSNLRQKFFTGAMVLLVTVFFIPAFAGAFTPGDCKLDRGFGMKRHHFWSEKESVGLKLLPENRAFTRC